MTYQPIVPAGGNLGWIFLKNTREAQEEAFANSAAVTTSTEYFLEEISSVRSAEDLVSDRRLLTVALGAFGLEDDIANKFFIQKVLEDGTLSEDAFANRLSDKRYFEMADAFGFHLSPPKTILSDFGAKIVAQFQSRQFEAAVGAQNTDLRLALGIERDLDDLASKDLSAEASWYTIMGSPPVRRVFEMALGLPPQIAAIDIEQQLKEFRSKTEETFGVSDPAEFSNPDMRERLIQKFLFRSEIQANAASTSSGSVALTLLQSQAPLF